MIDREPSPVLLVCMPFGPVFSPSLGLGLLKAGLSRTGVRSRVAYFSIDFAERVGQGFYSGVSTYGRPPHRLLAGEWVFAEALFGRDEARDARYVDEILRRTNADSSDRPVSEALIARLWRARRETESFLDDCLRKIVAEKPRLVGFTSVFHQHLASLALAQRVKRELPGCSVVIGGANCEGAMGAETVRQFPFVDAVVSGEADVVFPELVSRVLAGHPIDGLVGVRTPSRAAAELAARRFPNAPPVQHMDDLPEPDFGDYFEQFAASRYQRAWQPSLYFETSRGCWWGERQHCTFCGLNGSTMAYRSKSAERALGELAALTERYPGCDVQVVDNILDLSYFKDFVPMLAERRLGVELFYETKSNLKKSQIRALRQAGISKLQPGIESLSDVVLKLMRKGVSALHNIQLLKWCKELGVEPHWNVLWGFPGEPPEEYQRVAALVPLLAHLPPPGGFGRIRLDRFSPNFEDAERVGFVNVQPSAPYRHIYPLADDAVRNLAYFFSYAYAAPRDLASYVRPLAAQLRAWKRSGGSSELISVATPAGLILADTRPIAREPFRVLTGVDRALLEACDAVATLPELAARAERAGFAGLSEADLTGRLAALGVMGLLLRDGGRYLALNVPLGDYRPSAAAAAGLYAALRRAGRREAGAFVIPLDRPARGNRPHKRGHGEIKRSLRFRPAGFRLNRAGELIVRV